MAASSCSITIIVDKELAAMGRSYRGWSSRAMTLKRNDPAEAGSRCFEQAGRLRYSRTHTCCRQMKAMQPDMPSFLPPSSSSTFDL